MANGQRFCCLMMSVFSLVCFFFLSFFLGWRRREKEKAGNGEKKDCVLPDESERREGEGEEKGRRESFDVITRPCVALLKKLGKKKRSKARPRSLMELSRRRSLVSAFPHTFSTY